MGQVWVEASRWWAALHMMSWRATSASAAPQRGGSLGRVSLGCLSDLVFGRSPDPEEGMTPGRSTAQLQLLRILLFGKRPELGHTAGSGEPAAVPCPGTSRPGFAEDRPA